MNPLQEMFARIDAQFAVVAPAKPRKPAVVQTAQLAKVYCGQAPARYLVEPKIDGVRVIITADLDARVVTFASRRGNPLAALDHPVDQSTTMRSDHRSPLCCGFGNRCSLV